MLLILLEVLFFIFKHIKFIFIERARAKLELKKKRDEERILLAEYQRIDESKIGWKCPQCHYINSFDVLQCTSCRNFLIEHFNSPYSSDDIHINDNSDHHEIDPDEVIPPSFNETIPFRPISSTSSHNPGAALGKSMSHRFSQRTSGIFHSAGDEMKKVIYSKDKANMKSFRRFQHSRSEISGNIFHLYL